MPDIIKKLLLASVENRNEMRIRERIFFVVSIATIIAADIFSNFEAKAIAVYIIFIIFSTLRTTEAFGRCMFVIVLLAKPLDYAIEYQYNNIGVVEYINLGISVIALVIIYLIVLSLKSFMTDVLVLRKDLLTDVFSRRYIYDVMPLIIRELRRHRRSLAVMFLDCDNFKYMNDNFGHAAGDAVLRTVSRTLQEGVRDSDIIARLGGDEFVVMFPETRGDELRSVVERCINNLNHSMRCKEWPVTFSIGVVEFPTPPDDINAIIQIADRMMYMAKNRGKNTSVFSVCDDGALEPQCE